MGKKASEGNFGTVDGSDIQCSPRAGMRSLPGALLPGAHPRGGPSGPTGSPLGIPLQSDKVTGQGQLPSRAGFIQRPGNLSWGAPRAQTTAPAREARPGMRRGRAKLSGDQTVAPWRPPVRLHPRECRGTLGGWRSSGCSASGSRTPAGRLRGGARGGSAAGGT